ncbi:uncharacterized protein [Setaria viridis]|uniref:Uncharacterized protein n=1 Tax=Setaria viridis TaxID=4556 RepID=A0A4U6UE74_SETVI|nr:uncharacterized protein LOC117860280 isoform X2 [Setaria viridis]TKW08707.1 hypothetical protein SEVIR_6G041600v2 [Setaria viridis]
MAELAREKEKMVDTLVKKLKDPSSEATKSDAELPAKLKGFNEAFGTTLRKEIFAAHAAGADTDDGGSFQGPSAGGEADCVIVGGSGSSKDAAAVDEGKAVAVAKSADRVLDLKEFEELARGLGDGDLARLSASLGKKVAIAADVAMERVESQERGVLAQMEKMTRFEARVADLEQQNRILDGIKDKLRGINSGLKENNDVLMKTCEELGEKYEKLEDKSGRLEEENLKLKENLEDNAKIIDELRSAADKDAQTIAEQAKLIKIIGPELEEKTNFIKEADDLLRANFAVLYENYKSALEVFGAEPLPYPGDGDVVKIFDWMREEFEVLPEVISGLNDYAASFCLDSTLQLLEKEGCNHFMALSADDY